MNSNFKVVILCGDEGIHLCEENENLKPKLCEAFLI